MQVKTFVINPLCCEQSEEEANKFLRSHRVLQLDRQYAKERGCALSCRNIITNNP